MGKEPEFYRKKLDNGVVVLLEKREIPVVAVSSSVKFGAQFESADIKGVSHFIEHLLFKGTKNRSVDQIPKEVESKGGIINAFTSEEITSYWNKLPSKYFKLGADISRDLVLNPVFEANALERERKVVLEEIKMYKDNPSTYVLEKIKEMLYEPPFCLPISGSIESVSGISRKKIIDLFKENYSSNSTIFCVVGKTDFEVVLEEAKKFPNTKKEIKNIPIVKRNQELIEKRKGIDQAHEIIGFHMPCLGDKNRYAAEIFDSILGGGMSSRLFQELREKKGLCYAVKSSLEQSKDYAYGVVYVGTVKEKVKEVKEIVLREIKKLVNLNQRDLSEAKERLIGLKEINKEKCDSTMIELLQEEIGGNAENYYKYEEKIKKISLDQVKDVANLKGYGFFALIPE